MKTLKNEENTLLILPGDKNTFEVLKKLFEYRVEKFFFLINNLRIIKPNLLDIYTYYSEINEFKNFKLNQKYLYKELNEVLRINTKDQIKNIVIIPDFEEIENIEEYKMRIEYIMKKKDFLGLLKRHNEKNNNFKVILFQNFYRSHIRSLKEKKINAYEKELEDFLIQSGCNYLIIKFPGCLNRENDFEQITNDKLNIDQLSCLINESLNLSENNKILYFVKYDMMFNKVFRSFNYFFKVNKINRDLENSLEILPHPTLNKKKFRYGINLIFGGFVLHSIGHILRKLV